MLTEEKYSNYNEFGQSASVMIAPSRFIIDLSVGRCAD